jgi:hypothetical protein
LQNHKEKNLDSNKRISEPTKFQKNYKNIKTTTKDLQKHKNLESNKELAFDLQIGMLHSAYVYHMQRIKHIYIPKIKNDEKNCLYCATLMSTIKLPSYVFQSWDLVSFTNPSLNHDHDFVVFQALAKNEHCNHHLESFKLLLLTIMRLEHF